MFYRFIMLRNSSGFYTYAIYEHLKEWPAFNLDRFRVAFKLRKDKYAYIHIFILKNEFKKTQ